MYNKQVKYRRGSVSMNSEYCWWLYKFCERDFSKSQLIICYSQSFNSIWPIYYFDQWQMIFSLLTSTEQVAVQLQTQYNRSIYLLSSRSTSQNIIDYWWLILTWIEVKMADTSYVGLHRFWRMSKHILPSAYTETQKVQFCYWSLIIHM